MRRKMRFGPLVIRLRMGAGQDSRVIDALNLVGPEIGRRWEKSAVSPPAPIILGLIADDHEQALTENEGDEYAVIVGISAISSVEYIAYMISHEIGHVLVDQGCGGHIGGIVPEYLAERFAATVRRSLGFEVGARRVVMLPGATWRQMGQVLTAAGRGEITIDTMRALWALADPKVNVEACRYGALAAGIAPPRQWSRRHLVFGPLLDQLMVPLGRLDRVNDPFSREFLTNLRGSRPYAWQSARERAYKFRRLPEALLAELF